MEDIILQKRNLCGFECLEREDIVHPQTCLSNVLLQHDSSDSINLYNWITNEGVNDLTPSLKEWLLKHYPISSGGGITPTQYTLPIASSVELGGIKIKSPFNIDREGFLGITFPETPTESIELASEIKAGTVKVYTTMLNINSPQTLRLERNQEGHAGVYLPLASDSIIGGIRCTELSYEDLNSIMQHTPSSTYAEEERCIKYPLLRTEQGDSYIAIVKEHLSVGESTSENSHTLTVMDVNPEIYRNYVTYEESSSTALFRLDLYIKDNLKAGQYKEYLFLYLMKDNILDIYNLGEKYNVVICLPKSAYITKPKEGELYSIEGYGEEFYRMSFNNTETFMSVKFKVHNISETRYNDITIDYYITLESGFKYDEK